MSLSIVQKLCLIGAFAFLAASSPAAVLDSSLSRQLKESSGIRARENDSEESPPPPAIDLLRGQMSNPAEILSVLLIIGGDVIQKAIAQQSGSPLGITPVAFSFGWVAYTFNAVMSVFGDGVLMPRPEDELCVVDLNSGTRKRNESWVLWRLVRDIEISEQKNTIRIFWMEPGEGKPTLDWLTGFYAICLVIQLILAGIPWWKRGNWIIFFITCAGSVLATATGSLPQWKREKYDARQNKGDTSYILTRGNGHPHSFAFMSEPGLQHPVPAGFRLQDLAIVRPDRVESRATKVVIPILAALWVALLIAVSGLQRDTWFLFAVGAVGMVQNVIAAGMPRTPSAHGIPLRESGQYKMENNKLMDLLKGAERKFPGVGLGMLDIYFENTKLNEEETDFWNKARETLDHRKEIWQNRRPTIKEPGLGALIDTMGDYKLPAPVVKLPRSPITPTGTPTGTLGKRSAVVLNEDAITPVEDKSPGGYSK